MRKAKFVKYQNGNYKVYIDLLTGTKIRFNNEDKFIPDTIESMDIKITNCCDMGCPMCHEDSTPDGKHADLLSPSFIDKLHLYTELAIGGGNPLSHPDLEEFLIKCKKLNLIPSMTVNQVHFEKEYDRIKKLVDEKLIYGLGISLVKYSKDFVEKVKTIPSAVIHTIAGLTTMEDYNLLKNNGLKVLVLGYKLFRRGYNLFNNTNKGPEITRKIEELKSNLKAIVDENWFEVISFDNLALEQLDVKSLMSEDEWEQFYMGDDGIGEDFDSATMYVDMVERQFAKNSCDPVRFNLKDTIEEMYNFLRSK